MLCCYVHLFLLRRKLGLYADLRMVGWDRGQEEEGTEVVAVVVVEHLVGNVKRHEEVVGQGKGWVMKEMEEETGAILKEGSAPVKKTIGSLLSL